MLTVSSSEDYLGNSTVDNGIKPTQFEHQIENAKLNPRQRWAGLTWVPFVLNFANKSGCYGLFKVIGPIDIGAIELGVYRRNVRLVYRTNLHPPSFSTLCSK